MPSRRDVLAATATAAPTAALGGCLSRLAPSPTGHLELKAVSVEWRHRGRTYADEPLRIEFDRSEDRIAGRYDPTLLGSAYDSGEVGVPADLHAELSRRFDVEYVVGVCGEEFAVRGESDGCRNAPTDRRDFNRVQASDRVEVRSPGRGFDVVAVPGDAGEVSEVAVRAFDFAGLHADHGLPDVEA